MPDSPKPLHLLITRLSAHGDVIQTLPLLGLIKRHCPHVRVGWVVESSAAPLLEGHPDIDTLHVSHRKRWLKTITQTPWAIFKVLGEGWAFIQEIRNAGYTHSVDVQGLLKSALIPFLAGIPNRYGYKATREWADRFYTHCIPPHNMQDENTPTVVWFSQFAHHVLGVDVTPYAEDPTRLPYPLTPPSVADEEYIQQRLTQGFRHPDAPVVVVAPFTLWLSKQWPIERWQQVLAALSAMSVRVVVVGSPEDARRYPDLTANIAADVVQNWLGKTTWPQLQALMHRAQRFIGQDSAPLHVAQAVAHTHPNGLPIITALFGPTAPLRTGPIGAQHTVLSTHLPCQPCFKRRCPIKTDDCMKGLSSHTVVAHLAQSLARLQAEPTS